MRLACAPPLSLTSQPSPCHHVRAACLHSNNIRDLGLGVCMAPAHTGLLLSRRARCVQPMLHSMCLPLSAHELGSLYLRLCNLISIHRMSWQSSWRAASNRTQKTCLAGVHMHGVMHQTLMQARCADSKHAWCAHCYADQQPKWATNDRACATTTTTTTTM